MWAGKKLIKWRKLMIKIFSRLYLMGQSGKRPDVANRCRLKNISNACEEQLIQFKGKRFVNIIPKYYFYSFV